ncbi:MAG: FadR family transcriptional regulator [Oscillospiraceae bacterium]|nr:FadR family transcriptional regulator [Oscillospiraceae bacterium]
MSKEKTDREAMPLLRPVETQRASEAIYEQIKTLIVQGKFKPGDRLPSERALMELMNRSRPTIREALRMLERAGFIHTTPGGTGAVVQQPSPDIVIQSLDAMLQIGKVSLEELGEFRLHNDVAVARWAAQRRTQTDIDTLSEILTESERLIQAKNWEGFMDQDPAFHSSLARAGKNEVAAIMSHVLSTLSNPITLSTFWNQTPDAIGKQSLSILKMHRNIFDAVCSGDPHAAEDAMTVHILAFVKDNPGARRCNS